MSDKLANAGTEAMTKAMDTFRSSADEFAKMFSDMRFPGMPDQERLLEAHKRNVEALTQANRIAMEGVQTVVRRNMELLQQTMSEASETVQALTSGGASQDKGAHQAELLKRAYERAVTHARELGELVQKTNTDAADLLNRRFVEAMTEVKGLIAQAKTTKD